MKLMQSLGDGHPCVHRCAIKCLISSSSNNTASSIMCSNKQIITSQVILVTTDLFINFYIFIINFDK
jgi:hypothetical protein